MRRSTRYRIFYLLPITAAEPDTKRRVWAMAAAGMSRDRAEACVSWLESIALDPRYFPAVPDPVMGLALKIRLDNERD